MPTRRQCGWLLLGAPIAVLVVALACKKGPQPAQAPRATPQPRFTAAQVDSIPLDSILAYARSLQFDATPGAFDERPVDFPGDRLDVGPKARIEPEVGSAVVDSAALAAGRIVARIRSDSTYAPAELGPWWTFLWVDKSAGAWRSLFIRSDSTGKRRVRSGFERHRYEDHEYHKKYTATCPPTMGAACARFTTGSPLSTCYSCPSGWCSSPVPH